MEGTWFVGSGMTRRERWGCDRTGRGRAAEIRPEWSDTEVTRRELGGVVGNDAPGTVIERCSRNRSRTDLVAGRLDWSDWGLTGCDQGGRVGR